MDYLPTMPDNSVDSIVTDPPYELGFMGKAWDKSGIAYNVDMWKECLRVLKPGGHLLAFGGTRTYHRMACAIEDAGFEIRDQIQWLYGSGFPKSLNVGKAVDKLQGNEREVVGKKIDTSTGKPMSYKQAKGGSGKHINEGWDRPWRKDDKHCEDMTVLTKGTSEWEGWGSSLKPANEPICLARKPLSEKTIAENVLKWGTGGLNIDGCRIETVENRGRPKGPDGNCYGHYNQIVTESHPQGRFPANVIHDGSDEVVREFPYSKSTGGSGDKSMGGMGKNGKYGKYALNVRASNLGGLGDEGSASRFFYCAKASRSERNKGCEGNRHPTVKPIALMRYLCRLITPPKGTICDPFMGSGSTGIGAKLEGFDFIGIELEKEYCEIAQARIDNWEEEKKPKDTAKQQRLF